MVSNKSVSSTLKAITCLLLLALTVTSAASARILDEEMPQTALVAPEASDPVDDAEVEISPTALVSGVAPVVIPSITQANANSDTTISANIANTNPAHATDTDISTIADVAPEVSVAAPVASQPDVGPMAGVAPIAVPSVSVPNATPAAATSATVVSEDPHPTMSFFMHNVLGGSHPTAKAAFAISTNPAVNSLAPFSNPNGGALPANNAIPLSNGNSGVGFTNQINPTKPNNQMNAFGLPCINAAQHPGGKTVQKPLFEKMMVIDDELTEGHELGSALVGKAQGFYVLSSEHGSGQCVALTAMFKSESYADSINFFGVLRTSASESQVGIMGGTGKYVNAKGYATVKTMPSGNHHDTDGLETMLEFTVYLA